MRTIDGYSKLSKEAKIEWLTENFFEGDISVKEEMMSYWHQDTKVQQIFDEFSENTISNMYMPLGIAPNFLINGKVYDQRKYQ